MRILATLVMYSTLGSLEQWLREPGGGNENRSLLQQPTFPQLEIACILEAGRWQLCSTARSKSLMALGGRGFHMSCATSVPNLRYLLYSFVRPLPTSCNSVGLLVAAANV